MVSSKFLQAIASLVVLCAAYWSYDQWVAPWIEPPVQESIEPSAAVAAYATPTTQFQSLLEPLFHAESWERSPDVTVARKGNVLLIFRSKTEDGQLHLKPCTMVYLASNQGERTWMIQAAEGAELQFDKPFDMRIGATGRLLSGFLPGHVVITGTPQLADGSDQIEIDTQGVQLTEQSISTTRAIHFRFGHSFGSGRDLTIRLNGGSTGPIQRLPTLSPGKIQSVELVHLDQAVISLPAKEDPTRFPQKAPKGIPVEVACSGPMIWDLAAGIAQLNRDVRITRRRDGLPPEQLQCDQLTAHLVVSSEPQSHNASPVPRLRLDRVVASGQPAILTTTTSGSHQSQRWHQLTSARFEYHPTAGTSETLQSGSGLMGGFKAFGVGDYQTGMATASGPEPGSDLVLEWKEQVTMRPKVVTSHGIEDQAINVVVKGDGVCQLRGVGAFQAGSISVDVAMGGTASDSQANRFVLQSILAEDRVQINTPQLIAKTHRLNVAVEQLAGLHAPIANSHSSNELLLAPPTGATVENRSATGGPSARTFAVEGDQIHIQMQNAVNDSSPSYQLDSVVIDGNVQCVEQIGTATGPGSESPPKITMSGTQFQLEHFSQHGGVAHISGSPAMVRARGMDLSGYHIHLDRKQNAMWIDGRGSATLPLPTTMAARFPGRPATADVRWEGGMRFDGQEIQCHKDVMVTGPAQRISTNQLAVRLTNPVDFGAGRLDAQHIGLKSIVADGVVSLENRSFDQQGLSSVDRAQVSRLEIDHLKKQVLGKGPGWVESVRRGQGMAIAPGRMGPQAANANNPNRSNQLVYLKVDFGQGFHGDLSQRMMRFDRDVLALLGPVTDWNRSVASDASGRLPPESARLSCQQLQLFQLPGPTSGQFELMATGQTSVEGRSAEGQLFSAKANRMSYHQSKDLLVLQGDGRADAQLSYQRQVGAPWTTVPAQEIRFWPKANRYKLEGVPSLDLSDLGR